MVEAEPRIKSGVTGKEGRLKTYGSRVCDPGRSDGLTGIAPVLARAPDIASLLETGDDDGMTTALCRAETTGRRIGTDNFLAHIKATLGRDP
jgi:hypothetical protein